MLIFQRISAIMGTQILLLPNLKLFLMESLYVTEPRNLKRNAATVDVSYYYGLYITMQWHLQKLN